MATMAGGIRSDRPKNGSQNRSRLNSPDGDNSYKAPLQDPRYINRRAGTTAVKTHVWTTTMITAIRNRFIRILAPVPAEAFEIADRRVTTTATPRSQRARRRQSPPA